MIFLESTGMARGYVDLAFSTGKGGLVMVGWIYDPENMVSDFALLKLVQHTWFNKQGISITPIKQLKNCQIITGIDRPDVTFACAPESSGSAHKHGFILMIPQLPPNSRVGVLLNNGMATELPAVILTDSNTIIQQYRSCKQHSGQALLKALSTAFPPHDVVTDMIARASDYSEQDYHQPPAVLDDPQTVLAHVDHAYALGEGGLLFFGWHYSPNLKPDRIKINKNNTFIHDITNDMVSLIREDVLQVYRDRYPDMSRWTGFVCHVPVTASAGEKFSMTYHFGESGVVEIRIPVHEPTATGLILIKEILNLIPEPGRIQHILYNLFSRGLGNIIQTLADSQPALIEAISEQQFGTPYPAPAISVIVPLYGRYDFMRHQLAQFADDEDFRQADLIYVVDDPNIISQTHKLAADYHALFGIPFRVIWYDQNRGFAGANNIGVRYARGDYLLLLNSDVIPQHHGWLSIMKSALDTLPDAGAVGPLLQFADGSIQHAGMYASTDPALPGFILNTHRRKGMPWKDNEQPAEQPMLTAACLMTRTEDYRAMGGLDEHYIIGDFEDSDFCLTIRKQGKRAWLVPEAKLWHLERQSQGLDKNGQIRRLLTLFNCWRYSEKIKTGQLADPASVMVQS